MPRVSDDSVRDDSIADTRNSTGLTRAQRCEPYISEDHFSDDSISDDWVPFGPGQVELRRPHPGPAVRAPRVLDDPRLLVWARPHPRPRQRRDRPRQ